MPEQAIGIDLGTSTSTISVLKDGKPLSIPDPASKSPIVPSVVALNRRGELEVGQAALNAGAAPGQIVREAKRDMGSDTTYTLGSHRLRPEEVGSLVLKKVKEIGSGYVGEEVSRVVITVPAYFGDIQRRATMNAARLAGLDVIRLINEPVAAAMAFGIDNLDLNETLLVFDMGGGTLDVTLLEMIEGVLDVKATHGDDHLGGKDVDELLMQWARGRFHAQQAGAGISERGPEGLKRAVEQAKKQLSSSDTADVLVENFAISAGAPVDLDLTLGRAEFDELIEPLVRRAIECIDEALRKAKMSRAEVGRVLLVGGSTYIPRIREAVLSHLGKPDIKGVDPDLAVSQGAAISAGLALGVVQDEEGLVLQDAATHGLGILVVEDVGHQPMLVYSELMKPGTPVPYRTKHTYSLMRPDQTEMEIEVVQDPTGTARLPGETIPTTATAVVSDIPHALYGRPHDVEVQFSYDQNHVVELTATVLGTGKGCTIRLSDKPQIMSEESLSESLGRLDLLWATSPLGERHRNIIKRAESVLADKPENGERIEAVLVDLKTKISKNDGPGAQEARERLTDLLAEL